MVYKFNVIVSVSRGQFESRAIAVKRIIPECFDLADREVIMTTTISKTTPTFYSLGSFIEGV